MTHTIKPLDTGDTGGRKVMRPPHSLDVIKAIPKQEPTPPSDDAITATHHFNLQYILQHQQRAEADNIPDALEQALQQATPEGIVLSMPELIAAKAAAPKEHELWQDWRTCHTEENTGPDRYGRFGTNGQPLLVIVHGGGLLTPTRIKQAITNGLIDGNARYTNEEFDALLKGSLPDGTHIPLYTLDQLMQGTPLTTRRYGMVMPWEHAATTVSGQQDRTSFIRNKLVLARTSNIPELATYFDKAQNKQHTIGNYHSFTNRDPTTPQGRLLFLGSDDGSSLFGYGSLGSSGRFVGVAPEAPRAT